MLVGISVRSVTKTLYLLITAFSLLWLMTILTDNTEMREDNTEIKEDRLDELFLYDDEEEEETTVKKRNSYTEEELTRVDNLKIATKQYRFHRDCNCSRTGPDIDQLEERWRRHKEWWVRMLRQVTLEVPDGVYMGRSTCNNYTSVLGGGQKVK